MRVQQEQYIDMGGPGAMGQGPGPRRSSSPPGRGSSHTDTGSNTNGGQSTFNSKL